MTQEIIDVTWNEYGVKCELAPVGVDLDHFYPTRKITAIKRAGVIGNPSTPIDIKRLDMFQKICEQANLEPVYIFGKDFELHNKLYEDIDIFICPGLKEGAILEAACCKIPVITANAGLSKYLNNIKTFDTVDEAVRLIKLLDNSDVIEDYTEKLYIEIKNNWDWKLMCEKYWEPIFEKRLKH